MFEFIHETQPSDRRGPNEENVNVIVHDDFDRITVSDPTMRNVAPCNMSFLPPNSGYMPRVNLFTHVVHSTMTILILIVITFHPWKLLVIVMG